MIKNHKIFILQLAIVLLGSSALAAGQAGIDIAVLEAGVGARPLGMGGAFTAIADNADAPYWNPAGLGSITKSEITTTQTRMSSDADHYYVSYVNPAFGGTLGISWIQIGLGNITQTSATTDAFNEVQNVSVFSYFSNAYMLSYGKELNKNILFGMTAKYLTSDMSQITGGQAYGYSITPGALLRITRYALPITVGFKIDELINEQKWGTGTVEKAPPKARVGVSVQQPKGLLAGSTLAVDLAQILRRGYATEGSVGYEWARDGLAIRLGYTDGGLTAGAGFETGNAQVDYAYVTQRDLSKENVHRVSLSGKW